VTNPKDARSICDALLSPTPGEITFAVNRRLLSGGISPSDEDILKTMRFALMRLKLVIEPGGAAALASVLIRREEMRRQDRRRRRLRRQCGSGNAAACAQCAGFRFRLIAFTASPISAGVKAS